MEGFGICSFSIGLSAHRAAAPFPVANATRGRYASATPANFMFKAVIKAFVLVCILFVILYVGMNNTHEIRFNFPVAGTTAQKPIQASAALIFFGMFAIGLLAGTVLTVGGGGKGSKRSAGAKDK